jgi:hypothetical protein
MRFIPIWLHCRLIAYRWYRRKCGIPEVSPEFVAITRAALEALSDILGPSWRGGDITPPRGDKITLHIRLPHQYVRRAQSDER